MPQPAVEYHVRVAHTSIMSATFVVLLPLGALLVYLPAGNKTIRYIHAPFMVFTVLCVVTGLVLGVILAHQNGNEYTGYHPIIGYVVSGLIILIQPALGLARHLLYRRQGKGKVWGSLHRWLGRIIIVLGIINGGLGFMYAGPVGDVDSPVWGVIVYSVVAGVVAIFYVAVVLLQSTKGKSVGAIEKNQMREDRSSENTEVPSDDGLNEKFLERQYTDNGVTGHGITNSDPRGNATDITPVHNFVTR